MKRVEASQTRPVESMRAYLLRTVFFPLIGLKRTMSDSSRFAKLIAGQQNKRETGPGMLLRKRFRVTTEKVGGHTVHTINRLNEEPRGAIIYIHGGAYVANMDAFQWGIVKGLASRTGASVVVPIYPLAPEHDWRAAYAMIGALYDQLLQRTGPGDITLTGDSAGGGLALGFAQALRDAGRPMPGRLVLFSPWLNLSLDNPRQEALDTRDPFLARPALNWSAMQWAAGTPLTDPHISPVFGSLKNLPPILIFSGRADILNADAHELLEKARAEGAPLEFVEDENMTHAWSAAPIPEAQTLYDQAASFILTNSTANSAF